MSEPGFRAISIATPQIDEADIEAVVGVMRSGVLAQGPRVAQLEQEFADFCGTSFAVAVSNGTAALHAALLAVGVGPGDDVLVPAFTFVATANAVLMAGATPVFVDVMADDFCLDVHAARRLVTPSTKVILPVHLFGQICDTKGVNDLAREAGLVVVEDAAQAVGASSHGVRAGAIGKVGCFSLYATKNLMSGEGGLITTDDEAVAASLRALRQHGMTAQYEYAGLGYNYRMTDLHAAVAVTQLSRLDAFNAARRENAAALDKGLADVPGLRLPSVKPDNEHVYHQYTVIVDEDCPTSRDELLDGLRRRGIGANVYYPKPLNAYPHLQGMSPEPTPVASDLAGRVLSLPVHQGLVEQDLDHIVDSVRAVTSGA